jgi:hypothetical protein
MVPSRCLVSTTNVNIFFIFWMNHPQTMGDRLAMGWIRRIGSFKNLCSVFQNGLAFLQWIGKPNLSEFPEIYESRVNISIASTFRRTFENWWKILDKIQISCHMREADRAMVVNPRFFKRRKQLLFFLSTISFLLTFCQYNADDFKQVHYFHKKLTFLKPILLK